MPLLPTCNASKQTETHTYRERERETHTHKQKNLILCIIAETGEKNDGTVSDGAEDWEHHAPDNVFGSKAGGSAQG